jgi:hypothetical protein
MIISSMKQVIDLLTKDISEENKLLILQILHRLHKRSDHLTAMVLSKQIMALGKLMTKQKENMDDPVLLKAKYFLKSAFMRFAIAGLFVLMFKVCSLQGLRTTFSLTVILSSFHPQH